MNDYATRFISGLLLVAVLTVNAAFGINGTTPNITISTNISSNSTNFTSSTLPQTSTERISTSNELEEEKSSNNVIVKFYNLVASEFKEEEYSALVAEKVTEWCAKKPCGLLPDSVTFTSEHVIIGESTQSSRDLVVPTVVVGFSANNSYVLPKSILAKVLVNSREEFRQLIGRDITEVNGQKFNIKADVLSNAVISMVFAAITLVLLIITLLLRNNNNKREHEDRKHLLLAKMRRREQEDKIYKVRPGPEPIERYPSIKQKFPGKEPAPHHRAANANNNATNQHHLDTSMPPHLNPGVQGSATAASARAHHLGSASDVHSSSKLPPLGEHNDSPKHDKKKKKKKRKHRERDESDTDIIAQAHTNPTYE